MKLNFRPTALLVMLAVVVLAAGCATNNGDGAQESTGDNGAGSGNETATDGGNVTAGDNETLPDLTYDPADYATPGP